MNCYDLNTLMLDELVLVAQSQNIHGHSNSVYVLIEQKGGRYDQRHSGEHNIITFNRYITYTSF